MELVVSLSFVSVLLLLELLLLVALLLVVLVFVELLLLVFWEGRSTRGDTDRRVVDVLVVFLELEMEERAPTRERVNGGGGLLDIGVSDLEGRGSVEVRHW